MVKKKAKKTTKKRPVGAPPHDREEIMALVTPIALEHAKNGGFWGTLPAAIHKKTGRNLCEWFLNKVTVEHPEFAQTKKICFAYCEQYWDDMVSVQSCHPSVWIFIKKNIAGWRDKQPGEVDVIVNNNQPRSLEEINARIKELMAKDIKL